MSKNSNSDYVTSIEESASIICSEIGPEIVDSVFKRYGAHDVDDLDPADLPDVFPEDQCREYDRWRTALRKRMQYRGECFCPRSKW